MLIRHGESTGNVRGEMQGHQDCGLSEGGILQVRKLAQVLAKQPPTAIYSSPLRRARETAILLWDALDTPRPPLGESADLSELALGIFTGLTWDEARQRYPDLCRSLENSRDLLPIPGAESPSQGRARCRRFLTALIEGSRTPDRFWIITHGGVLPHLVAEILGTSRTWGFDPPPTACFIFSLDRQRWHITGENLHNPSLWRIDRFNDLSHLSP